MSGTVIVIAGPTASGKTALSIALAHRLNGEVVSADSMQVYRGMDIGTAKPTEAEREGIPHHMLDVADPEENFSVARYVDMASACVDGILARGRVPLVVGGTGLYIDSLLDGRTFAVPSTGWRGRLQAELAAEGGEEMLTRLRAVDPETAARLHPNDHKRIVRALEVWHETGETISAHNRRTRALPPRYRACYLGLGFHSRTDLWARINRRVDEMMAAGLAGEVRALLARGVDPGATAMQAIGYKELAGALRAGGDLAAAAEEVKLRTRQYAKRQLTWFRRNGEMQWYLWGSEPDFAAACQFATEKIAAAGIG